MTIARRLLCGLCLFSASAVCLAINGTVSGAYADPARDGSGFLIEVISNDAAAVYWYTYDDAGAQQWFTGLGRVDGRRIVVDDLLRPTGTRFGEGFNPSDVAYNSVGSIQFEFADDENRAVATYRVDGREGSQTLSRVTRLANAGTAIFDPPIPQFDQSGSWYNVARSGEGFNLQVLADQQAAITWFTFDPEGRQAWFLGIGHIADEHVVVEQMLSARGGRFGQDHDPSQVAYHPWGRLELRVGCDEGNYGYDSREPAFGSGSRTIQRLTDIDGLRCAQRSLAEPVTSTAQLEGTWVAPGLYASVDASRFSFYQTTSVSCLKVSEGPTAALAAVLDDFARSPDGTRLVLFGLDFVTPVRFLRSAGPPALCSNGGMPMSGDPATVFSVFAATFAELYATFDVRGGNWPSTVEQARGRVVAGMSDAALFGVFTDMLAPLRDPHVTVSGAGRFFNAGALSDILALEQRSNDPAVDRIVRERYLDEAPRSAANEAIRYGTIDGTLGYIELRRLSDLLPGADSTATLAFLDSELDRVMAFLAERGVQRVVVDLRRNQGGSGTYGLAFASRFAQGRERLAFSERRRSSSPDQLLEEAEVKRVVPAVHPGFNGPVAVLTSPLTVSAAESLVQALRAMPHVRLVGGPTRGALSRTERVLPNGWIVSLTPGHVESPGGDRFEAIGIPPDLATPIFTTEDLNAGRDSALDAVIAGAPAKGQSRSGG